MTNLGMSTDQPKKSRSKLKPASVKVERKQSQRQRMRQLEQLLQQIVNELIDRQTLLISYQSYLEVNVHRDARCAVQRMIDQQTKFTVHQTYVKAKLFEQIEPEPSSDDEF